MPSNTHLEVTAQDLELFKKHHRLYEGYTPTEIIEVQTLAKKYINVHTKVCGDCTSDLRTVKDEVNQYLATYGEIIEARLKAMEKPEPTAIDIAKAETKEYTRPKRPRIKRKK
jgi:hypothetical protein